MLAIAKSPQWYLKHLTMHFLSKGRDLITTNFFWTVLHFLWGQKKSRFHTFIKSAYHLSVQQLICSAEPINGIVHPAPAPEKGKRSFFKRQNPRNGWHMTAIAA